MRARTTLAMLASLLAGPASAQVTTLDDGSFTLFVNGTRSGFEQFSIQRRQERTTVSVLAYATVQVGERRLIPALTADTSGLPLSYKLEERSDGTIVRRVDALATGTLFTLTAITSRGRSQRDLRLSRGTLVLDDEVAHQYYFLARRGPGRTRVLIPGRLGYDTVTVAFVDAVDIEIGNGTVASRHLTVTTTGGVATDVWVDAAGRVLRVATPSRGFVAVRDEPPRQPSTSPDR